ncbi:MAG: D-alanine--D-alanine ligase [Flavobacterium sp.]|nr:D-alanine--D-alanine ligase [Flavobacterium sp.]
MLFKLKSFYIKLRSWEYWPMWVVYFPLGFYYTYLAIRARSFFFFSASNPSIETGGMFFESKWSIFKLMPSSYYPATILIEPKTELAVIEAQLIAADIHFPIIAKPDRGERGWCVKKLHHLTQLAQYMAQTPIPFLIQAYVNYPVELSIFYYRHPNSANGTITSVTYKKLLSVVGDGFSTIAALMHKNDRAFLQYQRLKKDTQINLNEVLPFGEERVLVPYGNHVLGTMFVNFNHMIDEALIQSIDTISKNIQGFYFGRFDLRCASIEDLKQGKNFAILELNGAGAEPAHIYHPGFSFIEAQKVLMQHFKMLFDAAKANQKAGVPFMSYQSYKHTKQLEKAFKQQALQA